MKVHKEMIEGIKFYDWLRFHGLDKISHHVANERECNTQQGSLLKRSGVKKGVVDYHIERAAQGYHGLKIELKIKPNKPSSEQLEYIKQMNEEGYLAVVRWSADECISTVREYLQMT